MFVTCLWCLLCAFMYIDFSSESFAAATVTETPWPFYVVVSGLFSHRYHSASSVAPRAVSLA